jgi:hypothetical protein
MDCQDAHSPQHLEFVLQAGEVPARAFLQMAERVVAAMPPAMIAQHADNLFGFLQRALDARQRLPPRAGAGAGSSGGVEGVAVGALVAATMKLSEKQFKPLFLQLLAWASTACAGLLGAPCTLPAQLWQSFSLFACQSGSVSSSKQHTACSSKRGPTPAVISLFIAFPSALATPTRYFALQTEGLLISTGEKPLAVLYG